MKPSRPRLNLEEVRRPLLIQHVKRRTAFHAKSTVVGVASVMRCMGEYLVKDGVWTQNAMRWVRGPRLDPRGRLPKRVGAEHLKQI